MRTIPYYRLFFLIFLCAFCCFLSGCSGNNDIAKATASEDKEDYRPWTRTCHLPCADGTTLLGAEPLCIDVSNASQGYALVKYTGEADKVNIQIDTPDGNNYKYFIEEKDEYIPIAFTSGNGTYIVSAFEHIGGDQYVSLFSEIVDVTLENDFLPYLYPNQYVNFTADSKTVKKAAEITKDASTDLELLTTVYHYVISHIVYDDKKAATVEIGYLPDIDETLETGTGICFDYAAVMAAMLRSQGVPCKMAIGYSSDVKHAWIDVYIEGQGWVDKAIEFNGEEWKLLDPTFASYNEDDETVKEYIGDGANYILQYNH